jgi:H+-transporting ATPase
MTGETRRKIQAVLMIAMLAAAEAQQVQHQVQQGLRFSTARGVTESASSTRRASDGGDAHDALGDRELNAKNFQEVAQMLAQQAKTMMAIPDFKRQARLAAEQVQAVMAEKHMSHKAEQVCTRQDQQQPKAFAEPLEVVMADQDFQQQVKLLAEQVEAAVSDPNLVNQAQDLAAHLKMMMPDPKAKHGAEHMKAIFANANMQQHLAEQVKLMTDPNSAANTTRITELFQEFMAAADPAIQRQTEGMRDQVKSIMANPDLKEQAGRVAEQMKTLMFANPGSPEEMKGVTKQMETMMADLGMKDQASHAMEALMDDPYFQKHVQRIAEEVEGMHGKPLTQQTEATPADSQIEELADRMVDKLFDRSLKDDNMHPVGLDRGTLGKTAEASREPLHGSPRRLGEGPFSGLRKKLAAGKEGGETARPATARPARARDQETGAEIDDPDKPFQYNHVGLTSEEAKLRIKQYGLNQLPEKKVPKWKIFLKLLIAPMPLMIFFAALIEALIGNYPDMGILLFINFANACIGFYETTKAADAVDALKKSLKPKATVKRDNKWQIIDGTTIVPGDMVLLASGSAMPADCRVNVLEREEGSELAQSQIDVDQAALTGESLPVTLYEGDKTLMGSTVVRGEVEGTVEFTGSNTFFGKTAALLGDTEELSNVQYLLIRIVRSLSILSLVMCLIVLWYVWTIVPFKEALSFVVVLMVASIPMAMEIVTTTTLALGSKELTKHGAIVTRLAAIEDMAGMAILCSDKTGTLTLNEMQIQEYTPVYSPGETQYSLLRLAAMAAKWKEPARDALDKLVLGDENNKNGVDLKSMECIEQLDYLPFDPIIKRTQGTVKDTSKQINGGATFKTSKGAPQVLLKLVEENGGCDKALKEKIDSDVTELGKKGIRAIAVAKTDGGGKWRMMGLLTFMDPPRPDTKETVRLSRKNGVEVKMITGDHLLIAKETSRALNMGDVIQGSDGLPLLDPKTKAKPANLGRDYGDKFLAADGFAQVYPEHKYLIVEGLRELGYRVGMTGDGVNDSPALKRADVGIAVFGATDAAKAAADIVLTKPGLSTIVEGILIARRIWCRVRSFLTYRIAATLQLLSFFFIAAFAFRPIKYMPEGWKKMPGFPDSHEWPQFFHMPVLMLMLITLLNDGTLITIGYDRAVAPSTPPKWNMPFLFSMAFVQSFVAMISSVNLLYILLHSWDEGSMMKKLGLGGLSYGKITSSIYLKVSVSDFLTLFSARAGGDWFFMVKPAPILMVGAMIALSCSTSAAMFWPKSYPDGIQTEGLVESAPYMLEAFVWCWSLGWWLVEDAAKVFCRWVVHKYNIFDINNSGEMVLTEAAKKIRENQKSLNEAK